MGKKAPPGSDLYAHVKSEGRRRLTGPNTKIQLDAEPWNPKKRQYGRSLGTGKDSKSYQDAYAAANEANRKKRIAEYQDRALAASLTQDKRRGGKR